MLSFAPDYDHLPLIAKVEVFQHALENSEGNDLAKVLCCFCHAKLVLSETMFNINLPEQTCVRFSGLKAEPLKYGLSGAQIIREVWLL
mgnify:CR=1 FL=1